MKGLALEEKINAWRYFPDERSEGRRRTPKERASARLPAENGK